MTHEEKLSAVFANDAAHNGSFYYAVTSTQVYCRPSCSSRSPKPDNIRFFNTAADAEDAGFRPCKRCRPDLLHYQPAQELALQMKQLIDAGFSDKSRVFEELKTLGVSPKRSIEVFKQQFGATPGVYADTLRLQEARRQLLETDTSIVEIAYALGFESLSAFYSFLGKHTGISPGEFRRNARLPAEAQHAVSCVYPTSLGSMTITATDSAVTGVRTVAHIASAECNSNKLTDMAAEQLEEYLRGARTAFTIPLNPQGSAFQQRVWSSLQSIPYGQTRSYKQVAEHIGKPTASRAVGMANNKNPIMIIIPCHRVVGSDGSLVGYAAGLPFKQRLLELEQQHMPY